MEYYGIQKYSDSLYQFKDPLGVLATLIIGKDKALLVDTCYGIGDLKGIELKLDYVKELGCNAIWLNPFYKSPFKDGGYDVEDFFDVDPKFGNLDDFTTNLDHIWVNNDLTVTVNKFTMTE